MRSRWRDPAVSAFVGAALVLSVRCQTRHVAVQPHTRTVSAVPPQASITLARAGQLTSSSGGNLFEHGVISDPSVLVDDGRYRMWFTAARHPHKPDQVIGIAYAE